MAVMNSEKDSYPYRASNNTVPDCRTQVALAEALFINLV